MHRSDKEHMRNESTRGHIRGVYTSSGSPAL